MSIINNKTSDLNAKKRSSFLDNEENISSNNDTVEDAEEIPSTRKRGAFKNLI